MFRSLNKKISAPVAITFIFVLSLLLILGVVTFNVVPEGATHLFSVKEKDVELEVRNFEECVEKGGLVWSRYPRDCSLDGRSFDEGVDIKSLEEIIVSYGTRFSLEEWEVKQVPVGKSGDSALIFVNKNTSEKKVLVESTDVLRFYIGEKFKLLYIEKKYAVINLIGSSSQKDEIYFMVIYEYAGPVFALNINSLELREIKNTSFHMVYSPKGNKAVAVEGPYPNSKIYLLCFENDTKELIVSSGSGETFSEQSPELDDFTYIKWVDDQRLEYKVYQAVAERGEFEVVNPLIETRIIEIPGCE